MPQPIELPNGRKIGPNEPAFIVAEIGQNHQGDVYTAIRLAKAAHDAGVDAVKFCKRDLPSDMTQEMMDQPYNGPQSFGKTYGKHREKLELSPMEYAHLKDRMERYNEWPATMFATACDIKSVDDLEDTIQPPLYKIASRDLDNLPLIDYVARLGKPVVLSTGMARRWQIAEAVETIKQHHDQIIVCYCVSEYPTANEHVRLGAIQDLADRGDCHIGYSDHTAGITMCQAAAVLGAVYIEKHLTLARAMKGTDHAASLEPDGMARMVRNIRNVEAAMKPGPVADVEATRRKLGRSIFSKRRIAKGEIITEDMLCLKSPGTGMPWRDRNLLIGGRAAGTLPGDFRMDPTFSEQEVPA